jgi:hypothetical protein
MLASVHIRMPVNCTNFASGGNSAGERRWRFCWRRHGLGMAVGYSGAGSSRKLSDFLMQEQPDGALCDCQLLWISRCLLIVRTLLAEGSVRKSGDGVFAGGKMT